MANGVLCLFIKVVKLLSQLMGGLSSPFSVKNDIHQGSASSPLLFIMVLDVLTEDVKDGLSMDLLCGDNLFFLW